MSYERPPDLPDYERPPLNELVLSIQFGMLPFANIQAGVLWQRFAKEYPNVEEQSPLEPVFETFGPLQPRPPQPAFEFLPFTVASRYWFVSADGNELLQVQRDRLIHNWRRQKNEDQYPRYEPLREKFRSEVEKAASFFREAGLGEIACNQCEVGYINLIRLDDRAKEVGGMQDMFTFLSKGRSELGDIERGALNLSYLMPNESGKEPLGRLHVSVQPVVDRQNDNMPALRLLLTARGKPLDQSIESAFAWLDIGRVAGVRAFTAVTTEPMHRLWGRLK